jgi:hypothetical protein
VVILVLTDWKKRTKITHLFLDVFLNVHLILDNHVKILKIAYLLEHFQKPKWTKTVISELDFLQLKDAVKMHFVLSIHNQSFWQDHTKQINFISKVSNEKMFLKCFRLEINGFLHLEVHFDIRTQIQSFANFWSCLRT